MQSTRSLSAGRFDALDTLRFLAVLVMVQGHAFYLTLTEAAHHESWYGWHNYLHGYTAPAFLFGAGLAFGYTTLTDRMANHATWGPTLRKRLYRYLSLFAIGYAIQLPPLAVSTQHWTAETIRTFMRVEALQHIGAVLILMQLLVIWLRRPWPVAWSALALGAAVVLAGPAVSRVPVDAWGSPAVAAYMSLDAGSTFPLLPWSGFVLVGVFVGAAVYRLRARLAPLTLAWSFVGAGLVLVAVSLGLDRQLPDIFGPHFYWKVSPYFFLRRLGWVIVMLGAFAVVDAYLPVRVGKASKARQWVRLISQHSLVAYVGHLVLLYGSPISPGLRVVVTGKLGLVGSSLVVLGLFVLLALLLMLWQSWEQRFELRFLRFRRVSVAVMAVAAMVAGLRIAWRPTAETAPPIVANVEDAPAAATPTSAAAVDESEDQNSQPDVTAVDPTLTAKAGDALSALQ